MAYVGNVPAAAYTNTVKDTFSGDGSTVAFTLSLPSTTNNVRVVVENVIQDPTVAYGVSGTTLTFTSAPPSGTNNIYVVHLGPAVQTTVPPDGVTVTDLNAYGDGAAAFTANRATSDGTIIDLQKNGSTVGSMGVDYSTRMYIGTGGAGVFFNSDVPTLQPYSITSEDVVDNSVNLGASATRFKDLYLSGGVYLGGTGAANLLDDYEEGTFTPTVLGGSAAGSPTYTGQNGSYTKIGQLVTVGVNVSISNKGGMSGELRVGNLPFAATSTSQDREMCIIRLVSSGTGGVAWALFPLNSATTCLIRSADTSTDNVLDVSSIDDNWLLHFGLTYRTSA